MKKWAARVKGSEPSELRGAAARLASTHAVDVDHSSSGAGQEQLQQAGGSMCIPAGFYHAGDRHRSDVALRYTDSGGLEVLLDGGGATRVLADVDGAAGCTFKTKLSATKFGRYTYSAGTDTLLKDSKSKGAKHKAAGGFCYSRVGHWPVPLESALYHTPGTAHGAVTRDLRRRGFAVVKGVYPPEKGALLEAAHSEFVSGNHSNAYGWYSGHADYGPGDVPPMLTDLLGPVAPYLDSMLGVGAWEHDSSLQVGYATRRNVSPRLPNYHVDHMFLNRGEPFSVLVGVPLVGDFAHPLGGCLAVFEGSHTRLQGQLARRTQDALNGKEDKTSKVRRFCRLDAFYPTLVQAVPGDVYLCHCRTVHGVTPNYMKDRSVAYLRIRVKKGHLGNRPFKPLARWTDSVLANDPFALFDSAAEEVA